MNDRGPQPIDPGGKRASGNQTFAGTAASSSQTPTVESAIFREFLVDADDDFDRLYVGVADHLFRYFQPSIDRVDSKEIPPTSVPTQRWCTGLRATMRRS
jgi:hypothetical protein